LVDSRLTSARSWTNVVPMVAPIEAIVVALHAAWRPRGSRAAAAVWALGALLTGGPPAFAETSSGERVRFVWVRGERTESCEDRAAMARRVSARLGREVFSESAGRSIEGFVQREGEHWEAHLYVRDSEGTLAGSRLLASEGPDCSALNAAVTLAIALAIDPDTALRPAPPSPPAQVLAPPSAPEERPTNPRAPEPFPPMTPTVSPGLPPREPARFQQTTALRSSETGLIMPRALVAFGLLPAASVGVALAADVPVVRAVRATAGLFYLPEVRTQARDFGFGLTAGWLGACVEPWHGPWRGEPLVALSFCGGFLVGAIHSVVYALVPTEPGDRMWSGASLSAQARIRLIGPLVAELGAELVAPLIRHQFIVQGQQGSVFQEQSVAGLGFAGIGASIP
jgi:hypothetical protein